MTTILCIFTFVAIMLFSAFVIAPRISEIKNPAVRAAAIDASQVLFFVFGVVMSVLMS